MSKTTEEYCEQINYLTRSASSKQQMAKTLLDEAEQDLMAAERLRCEMYEQHVRLNEVLNEAKTFLKTKFEEKED